MSGEVNVQHKVLSILTETCKSPTKSQGCLLGYKNKDDFEIVACAKCKDGWESKNIQQHLTGGLSIIGLYYSKAAAVSVDSISENLEQIDLQKFLDEQESFVVCAIEEKCETVTEKNFFVCIDRRTVTKPVVTISHAKSLDSCLKVRVRCPIPLSFGLVTKADIWKSNLNKEIEELCCAVRSKSVLYHLQDSYVLVGSHRLCGVSREAQCSDLYKHIQSDDGFGGSKTKSKDQQSTLQFSMYHQIGKNSSLHRNIPTCCPLINHDLGNYKSVEMTLPVDAVAVVDRNTSILELHKVLSTAVCNQLMAMADCITRDTVVKSEKFSTPKPYHFQPGGLQAILTVVYLQNMTDDQLEKRRKEIHETFCLPEDRPLFRRNNAIMFIEDRLSYGYLINPHTGITSHTVKGGTQYVVSGLYSYHHYMQDRFNDDKWGCAYRSLQTLMSWFRLQGYTDKPIASHKEIQQTLVDIGDKQPKFVGSHQWIGSLEVNYCLDELIGVSSKIMSVSSGAELATKGRELALHFQTQGTPVMIGGGVLAHTILGVDFNEVTGDLKFLILDPHYTGAEDLKVILDKGWCGWKGTDFWDQHAHYNLCMPQRPNMI